MHKKIKHFAIGTSILLSSFFGMSLANAAVASWTNAIYPWEFCTGGSWTTVEGITTCGYGGTYSVGTLYPSWAIVDIKNDSGVSVSTFAPGERITIEGYAENISAGSFAVDVSANGVMICSATDSCWGGGVYMYAPMIPGNYSIPLRTCWYTPSGCSNSSVSYTVSAPATVNVHFQ